MSTSWMDLPADHPFGLTALPYGVFSTDDPDLRRVGVRIGDHVLDAGVAAEHAGMESGACWTQPSSTTSSPRGPHAWAAARAWLTEVLTDPAHRDAVEPHLLPLADVTMHLPFEVADYVDFYASEQHATNVGRIFRPDGAAADAELEAPADRLPRPRRHRRGERHRHRPAQRPAQGPGRGGTGLRPERAARHRGRAGLRRRRRDRARHPVSASTRPTTTCSAWCCSTTGARATSRPGSTSRSARSSASPSAPASPPGCSPMEALSDGPGRPARPGPRAAALPARRDRRRDVRPGHPLRGAAQRHPRLEPALRATMYWSPTQMLAHLTVNGASLRNGDLFGSGTISGTDPRTRGSLLELTWNGQEPLRWTTGPPARSCRTATR